jgi:RNA recognition motif-containing protein
LENKENMKKIYVGNLPFTATEDQVRALFDKHGTVQSVSLINDRETGRPRGFGFVEISDNGVAPAIKALDGYEMDGRTLKVNEAENKPRNNGYGGGGGSRGGSGSGGSRW